MEVWIMKKFLKKLFFVDSTEKGAFFGIVLLLLGSYLVGTAFVFCGGMMTVYTRNFVTGNFTPEGISWLISSGAVLVFFILYFLFQQVRFWRRFRWSECSTSGKQWLGVSFFLWAATLICSGYCFFLVQKSGSSDIRTAFSYIKAEGAALPSLATVFLLLLLTGVLSTGKFFSMAGKITYKEIFTLPVKILAAVVLVVYLGMISVSLILQKKCEEEKLALGKHFGRPMTVEALKNAAWGGGNVSGSFWEKIDELYRKDKNLETAYSLAEFTPVQLASWRKRFESSKIFPEIDRMISTPLPMFPCKIEKHNLAGVLLSDLLLVRHMARIQVWHCRFAAEKGDRAAAMAALKRMDHLSTYLARRPFLISTLVKLAVDSYKIRALEILLAARIFTKDDLLALKQQSRMLRKHRDTVESDILWSEALSSLDYMEGAVHSGNWYGIKIVPLKKFRFLLPQFWLIYESNRLNLMHLYRNAKKFHDVPMASAEMPYSIFNHLAQLMIPAFQTAGNKFLQHDLMHQAIEFFIDQEIYRLEHGKLPDNLPLPVDPFSQKPMQYIQGKVTAQKEVFRKEHKGFTFSARQLKSPSKGKFSVTITIPDKLLVR